MGGLFSKSKKAAASPGDVTLVINEPVGAAGKAASLLKAGARVQVRRSSGADCQFALQWDMEPGAKSVDLDACAIGLNGRAKAVDAAFFNHLSACNGALHHHGDSRDGAADGDDETIDIDIDALPAQGVCTVALAVFAYKGGTLADVRRIEAILRTKDARGKWVEVARCPLHPHADLEGGVAMGGALGPPTGILLAGLASADRGKTCGRIA
jgi:stress response protein SCP2